jgi:hypothetical protein
VIAWDFAFNKIAARRPPQKAGDNRNTVDTSPLFSHGSAPAVACAAQRDASAIATSSSRS